MKKADEKNAPKKRGRPAKEMGGGSLPPSSHSVAHSPLSGGLPRNAPGEWEITTLGQICRDQKGSIQTGPFGSQLHASDYVPEGIPVVMPVNIGVDGRLKEEGIERISQENADRLSQHILRVGDIVFSRRGDVTRCAFIEPCQVGWFCGTGCLKVRIGNEVKADARFISFALQQPEVKEWLIRNAVGATMPNLNTTILSDIPLKLPDIESQKVIANTLLSLDDKIALNRRINQTLEQMAQALFQSWFVDFDPVKAKQAVLQSGGTVKAAELAAMQAISGKSVSELKAFQKSQPEQYAELEATAKLFPSRLVESELGLIPEGWGVNKVENILDLEYGKALKKEDRIDGNFPVYGSGGLTGTHNKPLVSGPGIIVGRKGTVGSLYWEDKDFFAIDTAFYVQPHTGVPLTYLFYLLQTLGLTRMNTDAAVPGLNRNNVYRLDIVKPNLRIIDLFNKSVDCYRKQIGVNNSGIYSLELVRDSILPKLLSGEIDVSQIELEVQE